MVGQKYNPDLSTGLRGSTNLDGDEVLERFAHLQTFNMKMTSVEEVIDPLSAIMVRLLFNHVA